MNVLWGMVTVRTSVAILLAPGSAVAWMDTGWRVMERAVLVSTLELAKRNGKA